MLNIKLFILEILHRITVSHFVAVDDDGKPDDDEQDDQGEAYFKNVDGNVLIYTSTDKFAPAKEIIENCAHPDYRPMLREYLKFAEKGHEPQSMRAPRHARYLPEEG